MYNQVYKNLEYYLYNYEFIDEHIDHLKSKLYNADYNQNYAKYIKSKSSGLEEQIIRNDNLKKRILKIAKWKKLIALVLEKYKKDNLLYYRFINLKYFRKANVITIQEKLDLKLKKQKDIQAEILQYIFFVAIKNNMLVKEVHLN